MNHKKKEVEGSLQVIVAILIAVAVLLVAFYPNPPKEVPQDVEIEHTPTPLIETAEASEVVLIEVRKEVVPASPTPNESFADEIIDCESSGRNIEIIDTNGKWSRGVAMFQDATWAWMSKAAGVEGSSMEPEKARQVLIWAVGEGLVDDHWVICYGKVTGLY